MLKIELGQIHATPGVLSATYYVNGEPYTAVEGITKDLQRDLRWRVTVDLVDIAGNKAFPVTVIGGESAESVPQE